LIRVVVSFCVWLWFGALSMLLKVTFNVVKGDVYHGALFVLGVIFRRKKGAGPFSLLLLAP